MLAKDRAEILVFYGFPQNTGGHIRTSNPIESAFAAVRLRGKRTKNPDSRETTLSMVFKLMRVSISYEATKAGQRS